ncbi:hypothetical protein MBLNU13_g00477t2 [Cladosporium sp. NU13]
MPAALGKSARKMSTRHNTNTQIDTVGSETPGATRPGVNLDQVMPEDDNECSIAAISTNTEQPKAIKMGIDLARKLFHSSRDEHSTSPPRVDSIFDVHSTQEEHILYRRNTTENFQRPMKFNIPKLDISKPVTSPPGPDETLIHRYEKRQADWKKRSMSFKNKKIDSVKRWSWKTWKPHAGQGNTTNATSFNMSNNGQKKLLPRDPIREPEDFLSQGPLARKRARSIHQLRAAGLEISVKPGSMPNTFWDQRRNPLTSPTSLSVIEEQQSQPSRLHTTHCHAASATHFPRQHSLRQQALTKSASTGMLRPGETNDSHLDIHSLSRTSSANDQQHIHPALRTQHSAILSAYDQQRMHPALRTQPCLISGARDQRHMHPTLRHEPSPRSTTTNQGHMHPAPQTQPSNTSMTSSSTIRTTGSAPSIVRSVPRVRIIPPTPLIDSSNRPTTYAERAILASKPPTQSEQQALVRNINTSRATALVAPLELHPLLSVRAQDYVALQLPPLPPPKPAPTVFRRHESINLREARQRATQIEEIPFVYNSRASGIRLISPPGLGVLACAELWAGGKYKRHKTVRTSHILEQHRYTLFPKFLTDDAESESMIPVASNGHGHSHSRSHSHGGSTWCVCAEYESWKTVTNERWKNVGVGCAEDGRWVVELWDPECQSW